ncbi:response regulator [Bacteroidota bacterium]
MPDELCNFIDSEFELKASVLFSYSDTKTLTVLGRSSNSKKNYFKGSRFNCTACEINTTNPKVNIYSNSACDLQISDSLVYEICVGFHVAGDQPILLKLAKNNSFTEEDRHSINIIAEFTKFTLETWLFSRGGKSHISEIPFSQLVNDIANELRSPANSIVGTSSLLNDSMLTSSQAEYAQTIKQNSHDLLFTINDLVDLARFELAKMPQQSTQIYVKKLLDETIDLFKTNLRNQQIEFTTSIGDQVPESFLSDDKKLRYVFNNLLTFITGRFNEGKVDIKVDRLTANLIQFRISDDFEKLTDSQIVSLFHPFSINKIEKLKRSNLTGISLTLVQKFVTFLGGDIKVSADEKKGTVFTFTINGEVMSDIESNLSKLPKSTSDNNKVLVIEDDYATSKLLNNYLSKWGYDPIIVSTEEEAFKQIEKEKLLAVILDIELPNTNGLELLRKIHEHKNTKNVPVIVCSIEPDQQKAFLMGAVEYFIKPINYNYLVEILTSYKLRKDSNILCVDDDVPTLNLIKQAIEAAGYRALSESDSTKVMDMIKDKEVDLAIIDLDMPEIDGIKLIELIKSENKFTNLPIIIYTGKDSFKEDLHRIDGLFEELLDKRSVNIEDLGNTIDSMINRYETPPPVEEVMEKSDVTKILLAEDYKHSQIIVTRLLKKNGFENVIVVENGEEALHMAEKERFSLVLMDMQMPIMNGFEATEKIRQIAGYKDVPIIALTAFAMKGDREKCIEAGATDYIPKPIDSKEFIEKVKFYTKVE